MNAKRKKLLEMVAESDGLIMEAIGDGLVEIVPDTQNRDRLVVTSKGREALAVEHARPDYIVEATIRIDPELVRKAMVNGASAALNSAISNALAEWRVNQNAQDAVRAALPKVEWDTMLTAAVDRLLPEFAKKVVAKAAEDFICGENGRRLARTVSDLRALKQAFRILSDARALDAEKEGV